ncbi:ThiF family adenylyltransferase [Georgenia halophila]|uniref:ThiF family adenylyltransferase n=1 Tax=Georgenia halophila TaxID=620889 RepID=A0ABP8KUS8_9MICO
MRLRTGLSVLWRGQGESQIGVDPRCAVVLEDLSPGEQRVLDHLDRGGYEPTEADLVRVGRTAGVRAGRVRELIRLLERSGVLDPVADRATSTPVPPEDAYWSRLLPDGDGPALLGRRSEAVVTVVGLDHVGLRIASHLAEAGIGTVLLEDDGPVDPFDVGPYHPADVGDRRRVRAEARLRSTFDRLRTEAPPGRRPDMVVVVCSRVADPVLLLPLVRDDVAHVPVVVGEVDVVVGPLIIPGDGPCTRCMDLHRTDADPAWPAVATQLRCSPAAVATSQLGQMGAALTAHQVLAAIDGRELVADRASLEVSALSPLPVLRPWAVHPDCGCAGVSLDEPTPEKPVAGRAQEPA